MSEFANPNINAYFRSAKHNAAQAVLTGGKSASSSGHAARMTTAHDSLARGARALLSEGRSNERVSVALTTFFGSRLPEHLYHHEMNRNQPKKASVGGHQIVKSVTVDVMTGAQTAAVILQEAFINRDGEARRLAERDPVAFDVKLRSAFIRATAALTGISLSTRENHATGAKGYITAGEVDPESTVEKVHSRLVRLVAAGMQGIAKTHAARLGG